MVVCLCVCVCVLIVGCWVALGSVVRQLYVVERARYDSRPMNVLSIRKPYFIHHTLCVDVLVPVGDERRDGCLLVWIEEAVRPDGDNTSVRF